MRDLTLQFLHEELKRVSDWVKFADQKIAFLAIYYSVLAGYLSSNIDIIVKKIFFSNYDFFAIYIVIFFLDIIFFIFGIYFIMSSIFPMKNVSSKRSLFFFGTVAKMSLRDFTSDLINKTEFQIKEHLIEQIHTNSRIADKKMVGVRLSSIFLILLIIFTVLLFLI